MVTSRAPLAPSGCPSAIAPPFGLTRASSSASPWSRVTASACAANASFNSITAISSSLSFASESTLRIAGDGPKPMIRGATPATAAATMRARGVRPCRFAASSEAISVAHAPSLTPEALPAVTVPSGRTMALSLASASSVVSRGCSSRATTIGSPFFAGIVTGTISSARRPAAIAASARSWLRSANASWSARATLNSAATFSAVSGIESIPYFAWVSGLTNRQPIVVSSILAVRENALSAFGSTNGARDILSTPPAIASDISPALIERAAIAIASMLEPHSRFTVVPGTSTGSPARRSAMRPTLRLSSPAWFAQP